MFHNQQVIDKQPVNIAALIVLIVVLVIGVFSTVLPLLQEAPIIPAGFLVGFGFIIIEVTIIWWLLQRSKLWPPVNNIWPLTAIICGAVAPIHLTAGGAIGDILAYVGWEDALASFAGAWPEETGKGMIVALFLMLLPHTWNKPWHGLQLGLLVGLGFELVENLEYGITGGFEHGSSDTIGTLIAWAIRTAFGGGLHMMFSALVGFGIGLALLHPALSITHRLLAGLAGFLSGFGAHFIWNYQWPESTFITISVAVYSFCVIATISCWIYCIKLAKSWEQYSLT